MKKSLAIGDYEVFYNTEDNDRIVEIHRKGRPWIGKTWLATNGQNWTFALWQDYLELFALADAMSSHLDFCGYGDSYERSCAEKLMKDVNDWRVRHGLDNQ